MDAVDDILEKLCTHLRDDGKNLSKLKICCVKCQGEISDKVVKVQHVVLAWYQK